MNSDSSTHGFLFADLRRYTRLVDSLGASQASQLLDRYRRLTREVVANHGRAEIKTEGASLYVVLPSASAALRCGLALIAAAANPADGGGFVLWPGDEGTEQVERFATEIVPEARRQSSR